jgi:uncharacterized protein YdiU (UPF0061 family)
VLTRVAASHIRIGTFQFFAIARGDVDGVRTLADHAIARHYPQVLEDNDAALSRAFWNAVIARAGRSRRALDACRLYPRRHEHRQHEQCRARPSTTGRAPSWTPIRPNTVFSSIDQFGRYAYANQPGIAVWNLARLAEALLPLLHQDADEGVKLAETALKNFQSAYHAVFHPGLRHKIGLTTEEDGDLQLVSDLLDTMARNQADFTLTFRLLVGEFDKKGDARRLFAEPVEFDLWAERWHARLAREPADPAEIMRAANPKYIPRNHRVEQMIQAAVEREDFAPFEELLAVVTRPFDEQPEHETYTRPPKEEERVLRTFCGT